MAKQRRSQVEAVTQTIVTLPTTTSTINIDCIVPDDRAFVISAAVTIKTAGTQTGGTNSHSLSLKQGSNVLLQAAIPVTLNTDAAGTYEGSAEGDINGQLKNLNPEGSMLSITDTVGGAGTINAAAVVIVSICWGI